MASQLTASRAHSVQIPAWARPQASGGVIMPELAAPLRHTLEATGYLSNGRPAAESVTLASADGTPDVNVFTRNRQPSFEPEVWWRSNVDSPPWGDSASDLRVYFKYVVEPDHAPVDRWQREIWNQGFAPLLWVISPERIDLYNGFGVPRRSGDAAENLLETFRLLDTELARLDRLAGRLAMETGEFWRRETRINRETSVDRRLLRDIANLERALVRDALGREEAQSLIGRSIFVMYLLDRGIVTRPHLKALCEHDELPQVLRDHAATERLFEWLRETFNGDLFPPASTSVPQAEHLDRVARFLEAENPQTGQMSLFPYRFDVIPVELISSIYEQFVHSVAAESMGGGDTSADGQDAHYTPLAVVALVLDEVFSGLTGNESVLDLTCGSGMFLVEALRRLVYLKAGGEPSREMIRETLYQQIYGVDRSTSAVRVAAFSLYLAALELDPDPQPPEALRFKPLEGRTLLVGDARQVEHSPAGRKALVTKDGLKKFDVIVGNPPWSFRGKTGTAARRATAAQAPLTPRGQSLDFVARARDFADDDTRFGMVLSAAPFFSRSGTGVNAARNVVESLAPVTLVNLSDLSGWLFPNANMPAIVLLARHRNRRSDRMTLVQTHWSLTGERSRTIEISPSDITTLPIASWKRHQGLFKAAFLGGRHDLLLLDELWEKYAPLEARLDALGTSLRTGITLGNRSRNAAYLSGLPFAKGGIRHFLIPDGLPVFDEGKSQWPRRREIYNGPLVLIGEYMRSRPRPVTAVSEQDLVYPDAFFGASFDKDRSEIAYLVSGILGSALASWYVLMTGSTFGLWIQRLKSADVAAMPCPDLGIAVESQIGKKIVDRVRSLHRKSPHDEELELLDDTVFDLYELDVADRIVVRDGLFRARWQWKPGRLESTASADLKDLRTYAKAFLYSMDAWLSTANRRRMRAEIYDLKHGAPYKVIRFTIEETPGPSIVSVVSPDGPLRQILSRIGERTEVRLTEALVGLRELRVHAKDEVSIIKPAARRHWLGVRGLEDADAVVKASAGGSRIT